VLVLVVITALAFDFTNGFHDTGNAMATSIATGALGPRTAVAISGVLNFVGAFALLGSQLTNDEVTLIANELAFSVDPGSSEAIKKAISAVTHTSVSDADIARVRSHLAAGGWPLAKPSQD
jgi:phosphate/sulfate permease